MAGPPPPARCKLAAQLRVESLGLDSGGFVKLLAPGGHRTNTALLHALDARGGSLRNGLREGAELARYGGVLAPDPGDGDGDDG